MSARGGWADLTSIMPGYLCLKLKERGPFWLQVNEINEKMSFRIGVKFVFFWFICVRIL